jgi:hypothetical protein
MFYTPCDKNIIIFVVQSYIERKYPTWDQNIRFSLNIFAFRWANVPCRIKASISHRMTLIPLQLTFISTNNIIGSTQMPTATVVYPGGKNSILPIGLDKSIASDWG